MNNRYYIFKIQGFGKQKKNIKKIKLFPKRQKWHPPKLMNKNWINRKINKEA